MIFTSRIIAFLSREAILGRSTDVRFENEKSLEQMEKSWCTQHSDNLEKSSSGNYFWDYRQWTNVAGDSAESFLITPRPLLSRSWAVVPSSTTRLITLTTLANIIINQITITALVVNHLPYHSLSPLTALTRQHHHQQDHHHRRLHKKSLGKLPIPTVVN